MTQEKKCFVNPEEISAVRLRCANCKAASIIPVSKLGRDGSIGGEISRVCPHCRTPSGFNFGTQAFEDLVVFNNLLSKLAEDLKGSKIEFSLQIECAE